MVQSIVISRSKVSGRSACRKTTDAATTIKLKIKKLKTIKKI